VRNWGLSVLDMYLQKNVNQGCIVFTYNFSKISVFTFLRWLMAREKKEKKEQKKTVTKKTKTTNGVVYSYEAVTKEEADRLPTKRRRSK